MSGKTQISTILLIIGLLYGCSGVSFPTSPGIDEANPGDLRSATEPGRQVLGIWDVLVTRTGITATAVDRYLAAGQVHYNVKVFLKPPFCDDCIAFSNISDDSTNHILSADVTLKNPTAIEGADVRGIVLSNIPEIYLANPDDYTTLYDEDTPPDINPFRLFGKTLTDGIVGGGVEVTEHFELHYNSIPFIFKTAADAITPVDALREPYAIENQQIDGDIDDTGVLVRTIGVDVFDRNDDAGSVTVTCADLDVELVLTPSTTQENHYYGTISNQNLSPAGDYQLLISAADSVTNWVLYDYLTIAIRDDMGMWSTTSGTLPNGACAQDLSAGFDLGTGAPSVYYPGGSGCDGIYRTDNKFLSSSEHFNLNDIDPLIPGLNPFPVKRIEVSQAGGLGFFADCEDIYDDGFFNGPVSSLLLTLFPGISGGPQFTNPGDGDSSRIYSAQAGLKGRDVSDDAQGSIYGIWADPDGIKPPEIYGLGPDFTRHDIYMGGILPPELVGSGPGKVSASYDDIIALQIGDYTFNTLVIFILESNGTNAEIEILNAAVDISTYTTTFTSNTTIQLGSVNAVDLTTLMQNPMYLPNNKYSSLAVVIQGTGGGYLKVFNAIDFTPVEDIGTPTEPITSGNVIAMDANNADWFLYILNDANQVTGLTFTLG